MRKIIEAIEDGKQFKPMALVKAMTEVMLLLSRRYVDKRASNPEDQDDRTFWKRVAKTARELSSLVDDYSDTAGDMAYVDKMASKLSMDIAKILLGYRNW